MKVGVVGGGVFGLAAAIELQARGNEVTLFERGPIPHPMATSTDVSKGIRRTWYGNGGPYVDLVERAAHTWREWEEQFGVPIFGNVFHFLKHIFIPQVLFFGNMGYQQTIIFGKLGVKGDGLAWRHQCIGCQINFCGFTVGQESPKTRYYNTIVIEQQFFYV